MKALKKRPLHLKKQLKYAITEANVLKRANHPFILGLHYAFQVYKFLIIKKIMTFPHSFLYLDSSVPLPRLGLL